MRSIAPLGAAAAAFVITLAGSFDVHGYHVNDVQAAQVPAWTWQHSHTLNLATQTLPVSIFPELVIRGQQLYSNRPFGMILSAVPGQAFTAHPSDWGVALSAAVLTALSIFLVERLWGGRATLLCAAATPLLFTAGRTLWPEAVCLPLLFASLLVLRSDRRLWLLVPLVGFATSCRPPFGLLMACVLSVYLGRRRAGLLPWVGLALGTVTLLVYARVLFDQWALLPGYASASHVRIGAIATAFISPARGVLWWTPWLIFARPRRRLDALVFGLALSYAVVSVLLYDGWGGDGFVGYRYPLPFVLLVVPMVRVPLSPGGRALFDLLVSWSVAQAVVAQTLTFSLSRGRHALRWGLPVAETLAVFACVAVLIGYYRLRLEPELARRRQVREPAPV